MDSRLSHNDYRIMYIMGITASGYQALLPLAAFYATALLLTRRGHAMIEQPAE